MAKQAALVSASRDGRRTRRRQLRRQLNQGQPSSQPATAAQAVRLRAVRAANNNLADFLSRSGAISKTTAKAIRARWTKKAHGERYAAVEALGAEYKGEGPFTVMTEEEMVKENGGWGVGVDVGGKGAGVIGVEEGGMNEGKDGEEEEAAGDEDGEDWIPPLPVRTKKPE